MDQNDYKLLKRAFDFSLAFLGLLTFWWLFPIVAILIKLDSLGPAIFTQKRVTEHGRLFTIYKFRSMVDNARKFELQGIPSRKLYTRFGRFIRKTHIDELPQLLNILLGNMSFIGPRAIMPEHHRQAIKQNKAAKKRELAKAGLTSLDRILFLEPSRRGHILSQLPNLKRFPPNHTTYDIYYVEHLSPQLDWLIFSETLRHTAKQLIKRLGRIIMRII